MIKVGIFGATGYTGVELMKIFQHHTKTRIVFAHSDSNAGLRLSDVLPCPFDVPLIKAEDAPLADVDVVFSCLPHAASAELCKRVIDAGKRVVDLSADFRLRDAALYEKTYKHHHAYPELLDTAVYGLPELYRQDIAAAQLIANPGCYPTTVVLGAMPLLELDALADPIIIADSKSGVSGAGRKPAQNTHFVEVNESLNPYGIGNVHRHVPEMNQTLNSIVGRGSTPGSTDGLTADYKVIFSPQLLPISRGMLTMLYLTLTEAAARKDWQAIFSQRYEGEPFVRVLPNNQIATIAHTTHTNYAVLSVHTIADAPNRLLIVSCLDNLIKGASGQAVQNMNLMFGVDEAEGLK
jgi:N-acetyl-gamma-glutamyl-phosphate reductase